MQEKRQKKNDKSKEGKKIVNNNNKRAQKKNHPSLYIISSSLLLSHPFILLSFITPFSLSLSSIHLSLVYHSLFLIPLIHSSFSALFPIYHIIPSPAHRLNSAQNALNPPSRISVTVGAHYHAQPGTTGGYNVEVDVNNIHLHPQYRLPYDIALLK